jgi:hypothetical protein
MEKDNPIFQYSGQIYMLAHFLLSAFDQGILGRPLIWYTTFTKIHTTDTRNKIWVAFALAEIHGSLDFE